MCVLLGTQLVAIVGSGLLAQSIAGVFDALESSGWFSTILNIFSVALNPVFGQAANYWGRKWFLVGAAGSGAVGCIIISRAHTISAILGGFCVLGIAFGVQALGNAVISEVLHRKHRGYGQAASVSTAGLSALVATLMGGGLVSGGHDGNFRIYWYICAGLFAFSFFGVLFCYHPPPRELQVTLTLTEKLQRLDWVGYFTSNVGLVLFCMALQWSENPYEWTNAHVNATFAAGAVFLAFFCFYEARMTTEGILSHALFVQRNFGLGLCTNALEGLAFFTSNSYLAYEAQTLAQLDFFQASVRFMMLFLASIVFAILSGVFVSWQSSVREPAFLGFTCLAVFSALMATVKPSTTPNVYWGYPLLGGAGLGLLNTSLVVTVQMATPAALISDSTALGYAARALGGCVGLVVNHAIFTSTLSTQIPRKISAAVLPLGLPASELAPLIQGISSGDSSILSGMSGVTTEIMSAAQSGALEAYQLAFRNAWIAALSFSVAAMAGK